MKLQGNWHHHELVFTSDQKGLCVPTPLNFLTMN
jgi:hypothetical protein